MGKRVRVYGLGLKGNMFFLSMAFAVLSNGVYGKITSAQKFLEVERKLKLLNKPAVKSIQSEDGDIIDCVDIHKQPSFDHPALKNHIIQMRPNYDPTTETTTTTKKEESSMTVVSQVWQRSGNCPEGTIPIRRIRKRDLLRANSLDNYGRKNPFVARAANITDDHDTKHANHSIHLNTNGTSYVAQVNHSAAILFAVGYNFIGAKGDINVWNPKVESDDEFSAAKIWLRNGPIYDFESVESGWMVNPSVYGDKQTRLFTYWTADASKKTGCYDLICSGFVQTSHQIALGASIDPVSRELGPQYQITIYMYMDPNTSNWWLQYGNNINIGYWPAEIFNLLRHSAIYVEWGGEVYSPRIGIPPHTSTDMGSGDFAEGLFGFASFIKQIRIRDYSLYLKYPRLVYSSSDEYGCYDVFNYKPGYTTDPEFYFGGPGRNLRCP